MPKLTGPLHSDQARGQLAKQFIFQQRGSRSIVKRYAAPSGLPTPAQTAVRNLTGLLMRHWPDIDTGARASWLPLALQTAIAPVNAYLRENYRRSAQGLPLIDYYPGPYGHRIYHGTGAAPNLAEWTATFLTDGALTVVASDLFATDDLYTITSYTDTDLTGAFDFRGCHNVTLIDIETIPFSTLLVTGLQNLRSLYTVDNALETIDLTDTPALEELLLRDQHYLATVTGLNPHPLLTTLLADGNELTSGLLTGLDIFGCPNLVTFADYHNQTPAVDPYIEFFLANHTPADYLDINLIGPQMASISAPLWTTLDPYRVPTGHWTVVDNNHP